MRTSERAGHLGSAIQITIWETMVSLASFHSKEVNAGHVKLLLHASPNSSPAAAILETRLLDHSFIRIDPIEGQPNLVLWRQEFMKMLVYPNSDGEVFPFLNHIDYTFKA